MHLIINLDHSIPPTEKFAGGMTYDHVSAQEKQQACTWSYPVLIDRLHQCHNLQWHESTTAVTPSRKLKLCGLMMPANKKLHSCHGF